MRVRSGVQTRWQQVPPGMRDVAPEEAGRRARLAAVWRDEFRRWGYREVLTPTLEYLETFVRGAGPGIQDQLFKTLDSGGELLALRPEVTVPIARMAATRLLQNAAGPLRLAYVAEVFRGQEAGRGQLREFTQAGVELLGDARLAADAEVVALAVESLRRAGLTEMIVNVGHLAFLDDLLRGLSEEEQESVRARLYRKEFAGIEDAVQNRPLSRLLRMLPELHGPDAVVRARAFASSDRSRAALDELVELMTRLREYGVEQFVGVDLSIIRDFSYYTGIVFEAYGSGVGYPLLGGGRYDGLVARFGVSCPATGFALGLERVLSVLPADPAASPEVLVMADDARRAQAIEVARELRRTGKAAVTAFGMDWSEGVKWAEVEGVRWVVRVDGASVWLREVRTARERAVPAVELIGELAPETGPRVITWSH